MGLRHTAPTATERVVDWDRHLSYRLYIGGTSFEQPARLLCKALEWSGHGVPWFITAAVLFMVCARADTGTYANLFVGLLLDIAVVGPIKGLAKRPRPAYNRDMYRVVHAVDNYSFPSGHTTRAVYVALSALLPGPWRSLFGWPWALAVAASRVALGRHHVLDVVAGVAIGAAVCALHTSYLWVPLPLALGCREAIRRAVGV